MYNKRRQQVIDAMDNESLAVIYADSPVSRDFFYLTGIDRENMALLLVKRNEGVEVQLFIEKPDPTVEKWMGKRMGVKEAKAKSQIDNIKFMESLDNEILLNINRRCIEKMYFLQNEFNLSQNKGLNIRKAQEYRTHFPTIEIKNLYSIIGTLRMQKDSDEVTKVEKAIEMTKNGLNEVLKVLKPGLYEYQVQATYEYSIKYQGSIKPSFPTIAGAGYNGTMLHYGTNRDMIHDGDLILLDLGAMYEGYCSDITRTYPANGKFTPRQKQIYDIVLKANQRVRDEARPGLTPFDLNEICKEVLANGLIEIGLIEKPEELAKYYMHGVSHHLGLDVHDVTIASNAKLRPGAIISNEPGLYIEEEAIGIRIEDDLLITEDGCRVLSQDIMRTTEEIEAYMQEHRG
jgi:Xaa-Pro aminopeptidase